MSWLPWCGDSPSRNSLWGGVHAIHVLFTVKWRIPKMKKIGLRRFLLESKGCGVISRLRREFLPKATAAIIIAERVSRYMLICFGHVRPCLPLCSTSLVSSFQMTFPGHDHGFQLELYSFGMAHQCLIAGQSLKLVFGCDSLSRRMLGVFLFKSIDFGLSKNGRNLQHKLAKLCRSIVAWPLIFQIPPCECVRFDQFRIGWHHRPAMLLLGYSLAFPEFAWNTRNRYIVHWHAMVHPYLFHVYLPASS